jgi:pimeloyl-ACP methyl ester carboxylesterase
MAVQLPIRVLLLLLPVALAGCLNLGDRRAQLPQKLIAGTGDADVPTLVIVLPGRRDNVEVMQSFAVADAIHAGWPEVDVQLTSATLAYYLDGGLATRVREQLIEPARARGYRRLILMGASMGGMGALIVDEANPGAFDHVILLAPYLGNQSLMKEIVDAGGIAQWTPGPKPVAVDRSNFQRELWRHVKQFVDDPVLRSRVWLAYGEEDKLAETVPVIAPALESAQIRPRAGGHKWVVWNAAAREIFAELRAQALDSNSPPN